MQRIFYMNTFHWKKNGFLCRNHDLPVGTSLKGDREWRCKTNGRYLKRLPSGISENGEKWWWIENGMWICIHENGIIDCFPQNSEYTTKVLKKKMREMNK